MNIKPHTTFHSVGSKTHDLMGKASVRLSVCRTGGSPAETSEDLFKMVKALVAFAVAKKLPINPASPAFIDLPDSEFKPRKPAELLALVTAAEEEGLDAWVSKKGNVCIGTPNRTRLAAAKKPADKGEEAALAAFMKALES